MKHTTVQIFSSNDHIAQNDGGRRAEIKVNEDTKKLRRIAQKSDHILLRISSIFPFDFFPDELTIDEEKINVVVREFFGSSQIYSIPIKSIAEVVVEAIPYFATLKIRDSRFMEDPIVVRFLKKNDAYRARRIIQGLMLTLKEEIELSNVSHEEIAKHIETVGKTHMSKKGNDSDNHRSPTLKLRRTEGGDAIWQL